MDDSNSTPGLADIARRLSEEIGPFRRVLLNTSRSRAGLKALPDAQIEILRRLFPDKWEGPTALGRQLGLARPTISNLVRTMESDGLVARRPDDSDARSMRVGLTDLAREQLRVYDNAAEGLLVEVLGDLTPAQQRTLRDAVPLLGRIRAELETSEAPSSRHPRQS
ncbi:MULTISPECIES: MarR family winged helix-turn-helix transcriptional regulator [unclassified Rhodococcus (in: high G+C Gram-positive bacteria)]|uniref:MarR family winged helix-turn-helix transcriptional regulator n=1 Tax=unclassified Rhodococcus (in: high G+C Gram-positive bacteria) TaxID=192944 RepID=UPI000EF936AD|nr:MULTISPECIES: MarR family transcriptional regulator [unclassified Rhodococcus (in: high G+C Gram-positive bacteria)]MDV7988572.1 MarR family transcriptional regulator [Rhodococcus sp. IEGM 1374]RMB76679.1 MarR family transcriptional regulator [Rhodococcus sp. SBT000017]